MIKIFLATLLCTIVGLAIAQPSATPAAGFQWVKTGGSTYVSGPTSTTPDFSSGNTQFGLPNDSDPASAAGNCGGNADGFYPGTTNPGTIFDKLFGANNGSDPQTLCEQRAINLTQWTNTNPNNGVMNGASAGTVFLPVSATLAILSGNNSPGTGAGGTNNRAWIIGGNGPGNTSRFTCKVDYNINWSTLAFGGFSGGSGLVTQSSTFEGGEPGGGITQQTSNWNANFGQSFSQNFTVPISAISESGGSFEVKYVSNSTATVVSRVFGNADGMMAHDPGMEGRASFTVVYDIWQLQQILPIYLTQFSISKSNASNLLQWTTSSDAGNLGYNVQVSTDGASFTTIKYVPVQNQNQGSNYTYAHFNTAQGRLYYRLQVVQANGSVLYSKTLSISNSPKHNLELIPNGSLNTYSISATVASKSIIKVYNSQAQYITTINLPAGSSTTSLDMSKYHPGIYVVQLITNGSTQVAKIIVQ